MVVVIEDLRLFNWEEYLRELGFYDWDLFGKEIVLYGFFVICV